MFSILSLTLFKTWCSILKCKTRGLKYGKGGFDVEMMRKLPDAEFDIMQLVWANEPPMTTSEVMRMLGNDREWKIQTIVTLMLRLSEKGFLRSEKHGKERQYFPNITKEEYLKFEMGSFLGRFHNNSFLNLVTTVYSDESLSDADIDELLKLTSELKERKSKGR